jgi:hypothetical protein
VPSGCAAVNQPYGSLLRVLELTLRSAPQKGAIMKLLGSATIVLSSLIGTQALADSKSTVDNAYRLCAMFDNTGLLSEECMSLVGAHRST